jgi:hypothetical protein
MMTSLSERLPASESARCGVVLQASLRGFAIYKGCFAGSPIRIRPRAGFDSAWALFHFTKR